MNQIHVLIIDNSLHQTGAWKSIFEVSQNLKGVRVTYALPTRSALTHELKERNKSYLTIDFLELSKRITVLMYIPKLIWNTLKIVRFVKKENISIIHVNDLYNMCGVLAKIMLPNIKLVYHVRLMPTAYLEKLYTFFLKIISRFADKIISVSYAVQREVKSRGIESVVIYDAISSTENYPEKIISSQGSTTTLLYLANFTRGKGHPYAIDSFAIAHHKVPGLRMHMAGGNLKNEKNVLYKEELKKHVHDLGLQHVHFNDYQNDIEKLIKDADIVLNFSESESFSLTCLEALVYGVPLIASDCGGPAELFENGKSGILVPNYDVKAMAEAIITLSSNRTLQIAYSKAGKAYVHQKFDLNKISMTLSDLYINVLR